MFFILSSIKSNKLYVMQNIFPLIRMIHDTDT